MIRDENTIDTRICSRFETLNDERGDDATTITTAEGAVTSRWCEGQLSAARANSCSSWIGANRVKEMEQEDVGPCWDNLPSVILQEIFSYLSHEHRIRASQVCRNWRHALFHPSFWKKITFALKDQESILWARFLADCFGLSVHDVTIQCDVPKRCVKESTNILKKLGCNRQLRRLFLEFSSSCFDSEGLYYSQSNNSTLIQLIMNIIDTSNRLEALSLGCIEELTECANTILEPLSLHHSKHLTHLALASVKDNPDEYGFFELDDSIFKSFVRLTVLTIDYDFVRDSLLKSLDSGCMERLVIHVHGWNNDYPGITDGAWQIFVQKNPRCELRLNLIHSYLGVKVLHTKILCPSMPLTHLKVLFCEDVNIKALHRLSSWYPHTLKSLVWVDSLDPLKVTPATLDPNDPDSPDPLVLVAWKCTKLVEVIFVGHKYYQENLLAIARLRGNGLKSLVFAENDIASDNESWHKTETITHEIQKIMGRHWEPLREDDLPTVIIDPFKGDSREVIMPLVLRDQK